MRSKQETGLLWELRLHYWLLGLTHNLSLPGVELAARMAVKTHPYQVSMLNELLNWTIWWMLAIGKE